MSQSMTLDYGTGPTTAGPMSSVAELDAAIDRIMRQAASYLPCLVSLMSGSGQLLAMGAGTGESVLIWVSGPGDGVRVSRGTDHGPGYERFFYGGGWARFDRSCLIPVETARDAMRQFLRTGRRPGAIQ